MLDFARMHFHSLYVPICLLIELATFVARNKCFVDRFSTLTQYFLIFHNYSQIAITFLPLDLVLGASLRCMGYLKKSRYSTTGAERVFEFDLHILSWYVSCYGKNYANFYLLPRRWLYGTIKVARAFFGAISISYGDIKKTWLTKFSACDKIGAANANDSYSRFEGWHVSCLNLKLARFLHKS